MFGYDKLIIFCTIISVIIVIFKIGRDIIKEKAIFNGMNEKEAKKYYKFNNIYKRMTNNEKTNDDE